MRFHNIFLFLLVSIHACHFKVAESSHDMNYGVTSFNQDWKVINKEGKWIEMNLPHTPRIEPLVVNDQWQGKLTYSKTFKLINTSKGKDFLYFEGVMHHAVVYVNNIKVKENLGGYLPFSFDITAYVKDGDNQIRVEVSNTDNPNIPPGKPLAELDFNYYGGIYRDVWLIRKNDIYISDPFIENRMEAGWLIHFDQVNKEKAEGFVTVEVKNESNSKSEVEIKVNLSSKNSATHFTKSLFLNSKETRLIKVPIKIDSPDLWSVTNPTLYDLSIKVIADAKEQDMVTDKVGIRKIELNESGFYLNGEKLFIRGTNRHQEYPYVGYAISNNANFRDALKIKNAGFDFVRMSHYPQDEAFLDACDELGILVMNAIPGWQFYQKGEFIENSFQDIRDMARRDRNHTSIIFWEVSLNESAMTTEYIEEANRILKEELPFDDTYTAGWMDHPSYDLFIPARQHAKSPHYWNFYKDGKRNIFISEYGDWEYYAHNAGFNQTAYANLSEEERNSRQLRSHGEQRLLQQSLNFQESANSNRKGTGTIGHANWLMFDYNRGYADDIEASGIADIFRIPKFSYHFYRSQRPPHIIVNHPLVDSGPMVKIASHWTANSSTNVMVYSNCDEVKLFLNNRLIATKQPTINSLSSHLLHPPFIFNIGHFEPGKLLAIGHINGNIVAKDSISTASNPTSIRIIIDNPTLPYEQNDVFLVYAEIVDENGNLVHVATNEIQFILDGEGELIGKNPVNAEAGIASILLKGNLDQLHIRATSNGLPSINLTN